MPLHRLSSTLFAISCAPSWRGTGSVTLKTCTLLTRTSTLRRSKRNWPHFLVPIHHHRVACFLPHDGDPAGCVALRPIDAQYCEMKRMFVYPHLRGKGIGLALAQRVVEHARSSGYRAMRLDTSIRQAEAEALYSRLGFEVIPPYYELSDDLRDWLVFMQLTL